MIERNESQITTTQSTINRQPFGPIQRARIQAALANLFIGDALSMPVHWFYNPVDIIRYFPPHGITAMQAAPETHPSSIMHLHSTARGGRGRNPDDESRSIVGDVILKGKRSFWGRSQVHYHHGLPAGQNTLNAWWARHLINYLSDNGDYDRQQWLNHYIAFMTADPAQHPDTYAESCHRGFFANLDAGMDPLNCGAVTHDTPSMGALVTVAPLALALLTSHTLDDTIECCQKHVWSTHPDKLLMNVVKAYVVLINSLLYRDADEPAEPYLIESSRVIPGARVDKLLAKNKADNEVVGQQFSLACYITDSWPSVCFLAARHGQNAAKALIANTNLGGENAHRGAVLGSICGLLSANFDQELYEQLHEHPVLDADLNRWMERFYHDSGAA
ncbi:MAG: ADP-ribosylglycohydrolase family protein [Granulosicoccus sp.]|nr:ADP-ribosylglycohydrolase family protein [Granulosicoccus sp.]